jgi:hypothetical protein
MAACVNVGYVVLSSDNYHLKERELTGRATAGGTLFPTRYVTYEGKQQLRNGLGMVDH